MSNDIKAVRFFFIFYTLISLALVGFSFTQIDLGLTLTTQSFVQQIQTAFQSIGYFHRPVATSIFIGIIIASFIVYGVVLQKTSKFHIGVRSIWWLIGIVTLITTWSYPALSYDLFNSMFSAKLLVLYGKNPYVITPLQLQGVDPWLGFMHWTHIPSVYPPVWLAMSIIPYIFGFGYLVLILWNFKWMIAGFYLLAAWSIARIVKMRSPKQEAWALAWFALNPFIIIESLVNAHNDIVMMGIALYALVLVLEKKKIGAWILFFSSIGVKFMTLALFPFMVKKWNAVGALVLMSGATIGFLWLQHREFMPWYALWSLPFIALMPEKKWLQGIGFGASIGLLLYYAPFLYMGNWDPPVTYLKIWLMGIPTIIGCIVGIVIQQKNVLRFK